jgi:phosphoglycerol transferase MdoB-like AlkP superfamily enzyme
LGVTESTSQVISQATPASRQIPELAAAQANPWVGSARFLVAWMFPALLGLYLKWYMMTDQSGFAREAQSMGLRSLNFFERISFFRGELLYGTLLIPLVFLILNRHLRPVWSAILTGAVCFTLSLLLGIQLLSLKELGRFSSRKMILVGLSWAWHEPGSNEQYLQSREGLAVALALLGIVAALVWAVRSAGSATSARAASRWKTAGELGVFAVIAILLLSIKSDAVASPYHQNSFARSFTSLWKENSVETGEFAGLDMQRSAGLTSADLTYLSDADLIARYRQLTHAPLPEKDSRYFGKEAGANILFFILETTPQKYLPVGENLRQFPNFNRLQENSFVGTRHYTTFPITRSALFSLFSSWYPIDDPGNAFDSPSWDTTSDFLRRLNSAGYKTAAFSPLRAPGIPDAALFEAVGFSRQVIPDSAITGYDESASWQQARIAADVDTLHLLEAQLDQWMKHDQRFAAAFLPQIGHWPYPDGKSGNTAQDLQQRGQAIIQTEDIWLGEILDLLRKGGQLDNTIVVVLGDHGLRTLSENPELRRGTIDETAFHVPLIVHVPRALDHTENISWLTSHIDLVPTLLDLLGASDGREAEQGSAIWNPALAGRTTFFFAKPMFGADGYTAQGEFYMWHYFSDTIYKNPSAEFDPSDIVPRRSTVARDVTGDISTIVALEKAWHRKFSQPASGSAEQPAVATQDLRSAPHLSPTR